MKGEFLTQERMTSAISLIVKQGVEKIDNVRVHAGNVLAEILNFE